VGLNLLIWYVHRICLGDYYFSTVKNKCEDKKKETLNFNRLKLMCLELLTEAALQNSDTLLVVVAVF